MDRHVNSSNRCSRLAVFGLAGLLCLAAGSGVARPDARPDQHTRQYLQTLDQGRRAALREEVAHHLRVADIATDPAVIPRYHLYRAVFLDVLIDPAAALDFPIQDREIIASLPSHADGRFMRKARRSLEQACRHIERDTQGSPAAARAALGRFLRAEREIDDTLNAHYDEVMESLTATGRHLVTERIEGLASHSSLVYSDFDLESLGFSVPGFVAAFLRDSCGNAAANERLRSEAPLLLKDELEHSLQAGSLQIFTPN